MLAPGTLINANKDVLASLANAGNNTHFYHTDFEALMPVRAYGLDFVLPQGAAVRNDPQTGLPYVHRLFLFNPNPLDAQLTIYDAAHPSGQAQTIAAHTQITHDLAAPSYNTGLLAPVATRIRATEPIWGLAIHDATGGDSDTSYVMMPTRFLQSEYVLPYTPDTAGGPMTGPTSGGDGSKYGNAVGSRQPDDTRVRIFYLGHTDPDIVDLNGDGVIQNSEDAGGSDGDALDDCPQVYYGCDSADPSYGLRTWSAGFDPYDGSHRNSALKFFGGAASSPPNGNLGGTRILATAPVSVIYDQDGDVAATGLSGPSPIDMGFAVVPPNVLLMDEELEANLSATPTSLPNSGAATVRMSMTAGPTTQVSSMQLRLTLDANLLSGAPVAQFAIAAQGLTYPVSGTPRPATPMAACATASTTRRTRSIPARCSPPTSVSSPAPRFRSRRRCRCPDRRGRWPSVDPEREPDAGEEPAQRHDLGPFGGADSDHVHVHPGARQHLGERAHRRPRHRCAARRPDLRGQRRGW